MTLTVQVNVRVPADTQELLAKIARRLREDDSFRHRLQRFMEEETDPGLGALLSQRLARVEQRLDEMQEAQALAADQYAEAQDMLPKPPEIGGSFVKLVKPAVKPPVFTVGIGRGRRLTQAGEEELQRLISTGMSITDIARQLGITPHAVHARVNK